MFDRVLLGQYTLSDGALERTHLGFCTARTSQAAGCRWRKMSPNFVGTGITRYDSGGNASASSDGSECEASAAVAGYDESGATSLTDTIGSWTGRDEGDKTGNGEKDFAEMHGQCLLA
ncbi:MAG: hypothetical protein M1812_006280 [Candelaria pacifica]|nr:MAG: hypothetical protein M1812_006280 [Candelaria pacifica]